jgi:uncharacterized membrane protein (DUF106 family)
MEPYIIILLIGVALMFVINLGYKFLVKQEEAKAIKDKIEELNKQMKAEQKAKNMAKVNELLSDMLKENNRLMKMTIKPMLLSFVIVLVFLPMVNNVYGDRFSTLNNNTGAIELDQNYNITKSGDTLVVGGQNCELPCQKKIGNENWYIAEEGGRIKFAKIIVFLPVSLPFFGNDMGWLGWYIISAVPIVIILRKLMKIYV